MTIVWQAYHLTPTEMRDFDRLPPFEGFAWKFWQRVAYVRDLDYTTIIARAPHFTALPLGHGKHWCFPSPLKCKKPPPILPEGRQAA